MSRERPLVLALVPARGGSKSIPRKNVRPLAGHPLIAYSIAAAQEAACVDTHLVSTDDEEIAEVARSYGAFAPFLRPAELAQDDTPDFPVFVQALSWLERELGYVPDLVVQLRPTSPLRPPGLVDAGVAALLGDEAADSLRGVAPSAQNPYKMWRIEGGVLRPLLTDVAGESYNMPRQALPETYWQTGHLDVIRRRTITQGKSLTGSRVLPLAIDPAYAVDIDTCLQWNQAESILEGSELPLVRPVFPRQVAVG